MPRHSDLGNITAIGVTAAWIFSVLFLPAFLAVVPVKAKARLVRRSDAMERLAEFVLWRRRALLWGMVALVAALAAWIPRIELNDQFALVLISPSLIIALRSLKIGLLSLIPNIIPAVMAFGLWGLLVGEIGLASSVVAATSLGIIVDDSVHFLSKYLRARRERGASPEDAVRYAFATVGRALWVTSAVLIAGFAILTLSAFALNQSLGLLTALATFAALVADFLVLPLLLRAIDKKKKHADASDTLPQAVD